jgi:hypothetical protein
MAESARMCAECGRPLVLFSGVTINGAAFHNQCWDGGRRLIPQPPPATSPDQARRSEGDPYARPRVMPPVGSLQLGNRRGA